jgi:hypothetical protein
VRCAVGLEWIQKTRSESRAAAVHAKKTPPAGFFVSAASQNEVEANGNVASSRTAILKHR